MMRGIVVCVNYADLLKITLPRNARHFSEVLVVTHPDDKKTLSVVKTVANAWYFTTDAFYRHGAAFNKGLAMEEGLEAFGRHGWTAIHDADVILPDDLELPELESGVLYGMRRRILRDPGAWRQSLDWSTCPISADRVIAGYFQLFDASHEKLQTRRPWYDVTFKHAGGCDGYFQSLFGYKQKRWLQSYCLHLGERDQNWWGRATHSLDGDPPAVSAALMERYVAGKGWRGRRGPVVDEHVDVPGFEKTGYRP